MNVLETIKAKADKDAKQEGKRLAVININPYSPSYVIRYLPDFLSDADLKGRGIVHIANP